jgi:hypothetical protein
VIQLYYWRKHLPTDTVHIATFNASQVPDLAFMGARLAESECKAAVARWNRDGKNTDWIYEYIGVRNEEVQQWEQEHA